MLWIIILKQFGPVIHHIDGVEKIVADALSRISPDLTDQFKHITYRNKDQSKEIFANSLAQSADDCFLLDILIVKIEPKKEISNRNFKLRSYMQDQRSGHSHKALDNVYIIIYDRNIYVPQILRIHVIYWYRTYSSIR